MKTFQLLACAISAAAALASPKADAQNLTAELIVIAPGLTVSGTINDGAFIQEYPVGVMQFQDQTNATTFEAFCVEPAVSMLYGDTALYEIQDITLLPNYQMIGKLVSAYQASAGTDADAAAVQWAIWEITTENSSLYSPSLLDGNVRVITPAEQATADLADQYLVDAVSFTPASLVYLTSATGQNVVSWNAVPEPGSAALAALSILCLLRRRR